MGKRSRKPAKPRLIGRLGRDLVAPVVEQVRRIGDRRRDAVAQHVDDDRTLVEMAEMEKLESKRGVQLLAEQRLVRLEADVAPRIVVEIVEPVRAAPARSRHKEPRRGRARASPRPGSRTAAARRPAAHRSGRRRRRISGAPASTAAPTMSARRENSGMSGSLSRRRTVAAGRNASPGRKQQARRAQYGKGASPLLALLALYIRPSTPNAKFGVTW